MLDGVKYLGTILDSKLNWNQHLQKTVRKAQTTFAAVRRTCGTKWGLIPNMVHRLYTRMIRPSIFYSALVWWSKGHSKKTTKTQLGRIQRMACLATTGAMKSTPYCSNRGASESDSVRHAAYLTKKNFTQGTSLSRFFNKYLWSLNERTVRQFACNTTGKEKMCNILGRRLMERKH
jgi:hypothetical protein